MFGLGNDQAQGLKRLFRPRVQARLEIIGLTANHTTGELACRLGEAMQRLGLSVQWDDVGGLLGDRRLPGQPADRPRFDGLADMAGAQGEIIISARQHGAPHEIAAAEPLARSPVLCSVFAARPDPLLLPSLYGAMKALDHADRSRPMTVIWCGPDVTAQSDSMRALCETNLERTVSRFLARPLEFFCAHGTPDGQLVLNRILGADRRSRFLHGLTDMVLAHFGPPAGRSTLYQN